NLICNSTQYGIYYFPASTGNIITDNWLWNNPSGDIYQQTVGISTDFPFNHFEEFYGDLEVFLDHDSDGDGLANKDEFSRGTDPLMPDTDGDLVGDGDEVDLGTNALATDTDGDGLNDYVEIHVHSTDPTDEDTDDDGHPDGAEVAAGTDPKSASSYPGEPPDNTNLYIVSGFAIIVILLVAVLAKNRSLGREVSQLKELVSKPGSPGKALPDREDAGGKKGKEPPVSP
ncbi:MAG: hypothetical protein ACFFCS_29045, partial [Candidatus Hodarchaeota archaeon]